jgi:hypothetical protein
MTRIFDYLAPKKDSVQVLLKRKGRPEAAIYKDGDLEVRSPSLQKDKVNDEKRDRNS